MIAAQRFGMQPAIEMQWPARMRAMKDREARQRPFEKSEIAWRFKALRRRARLTQASLGDSLGVCRQSICEIETERVWPHEGTWQRFFALERQFEEAAQRNHSMDWLRELRGELSLESPAVRR